MYAVMQLFRDFWKDKNLIFELAKNDFKTRYAGSYFGIIWAFVQPIMTIMVFWFVFEVGFRTARVESVPYILWFSCGLIPWFFFSDSWLNATNSFIEYSYLVKKVVFKINVLPFIKILSSLFVHLFFIIFLLFLFIIYGYMPTLMMIIQLLYYSFCNTILIIALSFLTASIVPFFKDLNQIINIILQFGMWMTPIMWNYNMLSVQYRWLFGINPMFYIVNGYRETLIDQIWFWEHLDKAFWFWGITISLFFLGVWAFKKLKPHFADVL